jgi:hypothetical protein
MFSSSKSVDEKAGEDNHLAVVLSTTDYQNVECENKHVPPRRACSKITFEMFVSMEKTTFGPSGTASDVDTPYLIPSCKSRLSRRLAFEMHA